MCVAVLFTLVYRKLKKSDPFERDCFVHSVETMGLNPNLFRKLIIKLTENEVRTILKI